jgi:hypothetical protein
VRRRIDINQGDVGEIVGEDFKVQFYSTKSMRIGGEGGIRTLDALAGMPHFECGALHEFII